MSDVSVVIATSRRPQRFAETLASLAAMDTGALRWEVIVIDNAADRETQRLVNDASPQLPVRLLEEPHPGKNRALNRALPELHGELIAFTDDDVVVDRDWLMELWKGAAAWPDATIFGGRVLPRWPDDRKPDAQHALFDHAYAIADFAQGEGPYSSGYVYGPNMALRAQIFRDGWRFNEQIGPDGTDRYISGSETSLTVALEKGGHRAIYLPRALVHHQVRPEQITHQWLNGRAFRKGRTDALRKGLEGGWRRIPRELILRAAVEYARALGCRLRGDRGGALDHTLNYWNARGRIYHCRVTSRTLEPGGRTAPRFGA